MEENKSELTKRVLVSENSAQKAVEPFIFALILL